MNEFVKYEIGIREMRSKILSAGPCAVFRTWPGSANDIRASQKQHVRHLNSLRSIKIHPNPEILSAKARTHRCRSWFVLHSLRRILQRLPGGGKLALPLKLWMDKSQHEAVRDLTKEAHGGTLLARADVKKSV